MVTICISIAIRVVISRSGRAATSRRGTMPRTRSAAAAAVTAAFAMRGVGGSVIMGVASSLFPGEKAFHIRLFLGSVGQENGVVGNHEDGVDVDAHDDDIYCFGILIHGFVGVFAFAGDVPRPISNNELALLTLQNLLGNKLLHLPKQTLLLLLGRFHNLNQISDHIGVFPSTASAAAIAIGGGGTDIGSGLGGVTEGEATSARIGTVGREASVTFATFIGFLGGGADGAGVAIVVVGI
mmetsp:Transcript_14874/g.31477  ORF Transcript_14874/g.31477 Transcript_14874/m.31477 type:complete len:239 (+) Transcript_14874:1416-2132(+)